MEVWTQVYNPLGSLWLSAAVAALPIAFFFVTLAVLRWQGYLAGLGTIVLTVVIALTAYGMPAGLALRATADGMAYGLWPISWIILNAVFLYNLSVKSGQFDKAIAERSQALTFLRAEPLYDTIRGDSRFAALIKQVGLPP